MQTILIFLWVLTLSAPAWGQSAFKPGSPLNPYIIQRSGPGEYEIRPRILVPDSGNPMRPGGILNPYIIERQDRDTWEMKSRIPDLTGDQEDGD